MNDISTRLRDAVDDGPPLRTDISELVDRAHRSRTRHRAGVAAVLTSVAVAVSTLGIAQLVPVDLRSGQPAAQQGGVLSERAIARRCAPQLGKYAALPGYGKFADVQPEKLLLVHPERRYAAGDVVALTTTDRIERVLCLVPASGDADKAVGFSAFEPAVDDNELIRAVCSEAYVAYGIGAVTIEELGESVARHGVPPFTPTPDLRESRVRAVARNGPQLAAALEMNGDVFACDLAPATPDQSSVHRSVAERYQLDESYSTNAGAQWYRGAGRLPSDAATIEYRIEGLGARRYDVADDGWYAFIRSVRTSVDSPPTSYRILDADGRQLAAGSAFD